MPIDSALRERLSATFKPLNTTAAARSFPPPEALSKALDDLLTQHAQRQSANVDPALSRMIGTASVDMWLRAVHSFLVSAALTQTSPIWASVSGYYSSHYSVRAIAHLLGYFQLFRRRRIVQFTLSAGKPRCVFTKKNANDGEHSIYWRLVKSDAHFQADPLFTKNESADPSDGNHRNLANYGDHIQQYPNFQALDEDQVRARIDFISKISLNSPPIPSRSKFPEIESVQVVAYHRLVTFRRFLDEAIGTENRFWKVHRDPAWARTFTNLQLVEQNGLAGMLNSQ